MIEKTIILNGKALLCRQLVAEDHDAVLELFHTAKDYFMLSEGKLPENAEDFFYDLPPEKSHQDKMLLGLFDNNSPVAVADIVRDFPKKGVWMTGLLLVHGKMQHQGLGKILLDILIDHARNNQAHTHRIGVLEQNKPALVFWKKLGYKIISRSESRTYGSIRSKVIVLHLLLQ
jgi:ribosomal protein S18 acetylase RimI-like enzyme